MSPPLVVVRGSSPIVLVAPHAGRRDATRRPWGSAPLKMNDLHTGPLALDLARRLDASAIVNDGGDRNDVDLGRITAAHDHAPHFLEALARALDEAVARHGRAVVLTIHGWNVVQPAVDLGFGVVPDDEPFCVGAAAAVSPSFAATTLRTLMAALDARGIAATPGLRYPARARENLLQLFTPRHQSDPRPLVRRLAARAAEVDALQLELALPLRIPGRWRDAFVEACSAALLDDATHPEPPWRPAPDQARRVALEFVGDGLSGLAAIDELGARLLLFPGDGSLVTFTGERVGAHGPTRLAGLDLRATDGALELAYDGPMLRFPDTTPFVDLEHGLAGANLLDASVHVRFTASHEAPDGRCPFGSVEGRAALGGHAHEVRGHGVRARREPRLGAHPRAALRSDDGSALLVDGYDSGFACRNGRHVRLATAAIALDGATVRVRGVCEDGTAIDVAAALLHRLPVVRGGSVPGRLLFAECRAESGFAGWVELPGH